MPITTTTRSSPAFIVEEGSIHIDQGHTIDWASVDSAYIDSASGKKIIPAGKLMRYVISPPYAANANLEIMPVDDDPTFAGGAFFLATDAIEDDPSAALTGYGLIIGGTLFENLMPDQTGGALPADLKAELDNQRYIGVNRGFAFRKAYDSRAA